MGPAAVKSICNPLLAATVLDAAWGRIVGLAAAAATTKKLSHGVGREERNE